MTRLTNKRSNSSSFQRLLTWSILVAAVFSGGLLAGYQLATNYTDLARATGEASSSTKAGKNGSKTSESQETEEDNQRNARAKVDYSFFDHLSRAQTPSATLPTREQTTEKTGKNGSSDGDKRETPVRFTLQVAAHASLGDARKHLARLEKQDLEAELTTEKFNSGERYYRLQVGKFSTIRGARHTQKNLEEKGIRTFITPL